MVNNQQCRILSKLILTFYPCFYFLLFIASVARRMQHSITSDFCTCNAQSSLLTLDSSYIRCRYMGFLLYTSTGSYTVYFWVYVFGCTFTVSCIASLQVQEVVYRYELSEVFKTAYLLDGQNIRNGFWVVCPKNEVQVL
jgi:hypothetical protein